MNFLLAFGIADETFHYQLAVQVNNKQLIFSDFLLICRYSRYLHTSVRTFWIPFDENRSSSMSSTIWM